MTARVQLGIVEAAPVDAPAEDIDDEAPMFAEGDEAAFAADDEAVTDEPATEDASTDEAVDRPTQG
jgi:hypothetical protein